MTSSRGNPGEVSGLEVRLGHGKVIDFLGEGLGYELVPKSGIPGNLNSRAWTPNWVFQ